MRLGRYAPIVCIAAVLACSVSAIADALTTGPWPVNEIAAERLPIGWTLTILSMLLVTWLILDAHGYARALAKSALVMLLAGAAAWTWIVWPSFWMSLGLDDCIVECIQPQHVAARLDVVQGKWMIAAANLMAACCTMAAIWVSRRDAA